MRNTTETCPNCGAKVHINPAKGGSLSKCPTCGKEWKGREQEAIQDVLPVPEVIHEVRPAGGRAGNGVESRRNPEPAEIRRENSSVGIPRKPLVGRQKFPRLAVFGVLLLLPVAVISLCCAGVLGLGRHDHQSHKSNDNSREIPPAARKERTLAYWNLVRENTDQLFRSVLTLKDKSPKKLAVCFLGAADAINGLSVSEVDPEAVEAGRELADSYLKTAGQLGGFEAGGAA